MKFQDDISNMNTHIHTDKPKPICPPLFQSWGHKKQKKATKNNILKAKSNFTLLMYLPFGGIGDI